MNCTVYIDESGEAGISKIRTGNTGGSSPYFVLAAAVVPATQKSNLVHLLREFDDQITKNVWRHATDLNHFQKLLFCKKAAEQNVRFFAVISNKSTLEDYANRISENPQKFYNKCSVYLLEIVMAYLIAKGITDEAVDVVFEKRNHDYDAMRRYITKIKDRPLHSAARGLRILNPFAIDTKPKNEEPLLKFADLVAHSVYQCANKSTANHGIPESRYLRELAARFGADKNGKVLGNGLKCIHSLDQLSLDLDVADDIRKMRAQPMVPIS